MAVNTNDAALRAKPPVNKVQGYNALHNPTDYVKGSDPEGGFHKIALGNRNDWMSRGPEWQILGPWTDADEAALKAKIVAGQGKWPHSHMGPIGAVKAAVVAPVDAPVVAPQGGLEPDDKPKDAETAHLQSLRDKLTAAGVTVDQRWGLRRLEAEAAALPLPRPAQAQPQPAAAGSGPSGVQPPAPPKAAA